MESARVESIDRARAVAVLAVILGHVERGIVGRFGTDPWLQRLDDWLYTFHVPLLFIVSGLVFPSTLRRPAPAFLRHFALRLLWPYALWSVVLVVVNLAAGTVANSSIPPSRLLTIWYRPISIMWFLFVLALCQICIWLLAQRAHDRQLRLVTGAMATGLLFFHIVAADNGSAVRLFAGNFVWFWLGWVAGRDRARRLASGLSRRTNVVIAFVGIAAILGAGWVPQASLPLYRAAASPLAAAAIITLAGVRSERQTRLGAIGTLTLAIYVTHIEFTAPTREILRRVLHVEDVWLHLFAGFTVAALGSIAAGLVLRRWPLSLLLDLSARRPGRTTAPAAG